MSLRYKECEIYNFGCYFIPFLPALHTPALAKKRKDVLCVFARGRFEKLRIGLLVEEHRIVHKTAETLVLQMVGDLRRKTSQVLVLHHYNILVVCLSANLRLVRDFILKLMD